MFFDDTLDAVRSLDQIINAEAPISFNKVCLPDDILPNFSILLQQCRLYLIYINPNEGCENFVKLDLLVCIL